MGKALEPEVVHKICKMMEDGYSNIEISEKLEIHKDTISKIRTGVNHENISKNYKIGKTKTEIANDEKVHKICKLIEEGYNNVEIAKIVNSNPIHVSMIRCGKKRTDISEKYNLKSRILTSDDVHKICQMMEDGMSNRDICKKFNVSDQVVSYIRCGISFTDISEKYNLKSRILTSDDVHKICQMMEDGISNVEISKKYNLTEGHISNIRCGKIYHNISKKYKIYKQEMDYISTETIHKICKMMEDGYRNIDISRDLNILPGVISAIRNNKIHKDISKNYNIPRIYRSRRIDNETIVMVYRLLKEGKTQRFIAEKCDISRSTIRRLQLREFDNSK